MRNSEYWQKRFKFLEEARHKAGAEVYKEIEDQYKRAQKEIEAEIDKWYRRFAENNQISLREAKRLLSGDELEEFRWDVQEYIRHGEENAISGEWAKELENASSRFHVSRLQALKTNIRQSIEALYGQQQSLVSEFLGETYKSDYYHTAFELMKGFEIGFDIGKVNEDYLQKVLFKPWAPDGRNFSDRIWENKEKLVNTLHKELTQSIMTGADPQKAIDAIAHDMNVSKANAGRLVMTESAYFGSLAQKDCFNDLDVEEYEIVATLDDKTSEICQEMDGQHFPMKDFEAGVTAPPFHVNCRSCTCPYFNDEFSLGERAARDEDGEVYYVPADMTYPEWKEAFVDGGSKEGLNEVVNSDTIKIDTRNGIFYNANAGSEGPDAPEYIRAIKVKDIEYKGVKPLKEELTIDQIIARVGGEDQAEYGSCASVALAYIGNRNGLDVLDFRGGDSTQLIADTDILKSVTKAASGRIVEGLDNYNNALKLLETIKEGEEYCLIVGEHAAIVQKIGDMKYYLELQAGNANGLKLFWDTELLERFYCRDPKDITDGMKPTAAMLFNIKNLKGNKDFDRLLGYLNTSE